MPAGSATRAVAPPEPPRPTPASQDRPPLSFELNAGQLDPRVRFLVRPRGGSVFITRSGATFALPDGAPAKTRAEAAGRRASPARAPAAFEMRLVGADPAAEPAGVGELPGRTSYYLGNDRTGWRTGIRSYREVLVPGVYRGVDLVYRADGAQLAYDFVVAPGADPGAIRLSFGGIASLRTDDRGDLVVSVRGREVRQRRPRAYELGDGGGRRELAAAFVVRGKREVAFRVEGRDAGKTLVIDPTIVYATYLGGSGADFPAGVARDASGNVYVLGYTSSPDFPGAGTRPGGRGLYDAFVTKLDPTGTTILYSSYFGGSRDDFASRAVFDASGNVYVAGQSESNDFPSALARDASRTDSDALVLKLDSTGTLVQARQIGGASWDAARAIDIAGSSDLYLAGQTYSNDFPNAPARTSTRTDTDGFVVKLSTSNLSSSYASYLGGTGYDTGEGLVTGGSRVYVTGWAASNDFVGAAARAGTRSDFDAYLAVLDEWLDIVSAVQLGGTKEDQPEAIARDGAGFTYLTGKTSSNDLPGATGRTSTRNDYDAFVMKISNLDAKTVAAAAYLGGTLQEEGEGIAIQSGQVFVVGSTSSTDFPGVPARSVPGYDAYVARLPDSLAGVPRSIYLGVGGGGSRCNIAFAGPGAMWVAGDTQSTDFPASAGALQTAFGGSYDAWLAQVSFAPALSHLTPAAGPVAGGTTVTLSGTDLDNASTVTFDGIAASAVTIVNASTITAVSPPHAAGTVDVVVSEPSGASGELAGGFSYFASGTAAPSVTSIAPTVGPTSGGTAVTIRGGGFQGGAAVSFGGAAATVAVASATELTAVPPPHAEGLVDLVLSNPDGQTVTVSGAFHYHAGTPSAPTISGLSPEAGVPEGGFRVHISGTAFQVGAAVTFGGVPSPRVDVSTASSLTAVAPAHGSGTVDVAVTNPDGQLATRAQGFTYLLESNGCGCGQGSAGSLDAILTIAVVAAASRIRLRRRA